MKKTDKKSEELIRHALIRNLKYQAQICCDKDEADNILKQVKDLINKCYKNPIYPIKKITLPACNCVTECYCTNYKDITYLEFHKVDKKIRKSILLFVADLAFMDNDFFVQPACVILMNLPLRTPEYSFLYYKIMNLLRKLKCGIYPEPYRSLHKKLISY